MEERFDEIFSESEFRRIGFVYDDFERVKSFIREEMEKSRKEALDEALEVVRRCYKQPDTQVTVQELRRFIDSSRNR